MQIISDDTSTGQINVRFFWTLFVGIKKKPDIYLTGKRSWIWRYYLLFLPKSQIKKYKHQSRFIVGKCDANWESEYIHDIHQNIQVSELIYANCDPKTKLHSNMVEEAALPWVSRSTFLAHPGRNVQTSRSIAKGVLRSKKADFIFFHCCLDVIIPV